MVDRDGRNFRSFYYEQLGLRNVEQKKALEILLKDNPVDVDRVATFSSRFSLPAVYRTHVWKILLGVLPPYQDAHVYVMHQRNEQCKDLQHALQIMQKITDDGNILELMSKMYLMQEGGLRLISIPEKLRREAEILRAVVAVFTDMFDDVDDLYWLSVMFIQLAQKFASQGAKMLKLLQHYLQVEDSPLYEHLNAMDDGFEHLPYQRWFESCFAEDLPDSCMERIWDKVVAGSSKALVLVGVALLTFFRHHLLNTKTPQAVNAALKKPCQEDACVIIVSKTMELWDKHGATIH